MVDFKLAFGQYWESFSDEEPSFSPLSPFWCNMERGTAIELRGPCFTCESKSRICSIMGHTQDSYLVNQRSRKSKIEMKLRNFFAEFSTSNLKDKTRPEIIGFMEKHDLIRLLPGVVPAFALRNRKWGKLRPI